MADETGGYGNADGWEREPDRAFGGCEEHLRLGSLSIQSRLRTCAHYLAMNS